MRIGTLFSGIGAPEQALPRVYDEHEIVFACEWDKFARQSYLANYDIDEAHFHTDINDMDGKQYAGKVDMIIGGSPCQDFSIAGLRAGIDGQRGQLIWQYFRIINEVQPEVFIYENVKGMVSDKGGKTLKDFLEVFRSIGYHCHSEVLNTKDYGVPQNRERIYIVGFKDANAYHRFEYAPKVQLEKRLKDVLEREVDEKYYLSDKIIDGFKAKEKRYLEQGKDMGFCFKPLTGDDCSTALTARYFKCGASDPYIKEPSVNVIGKLDMKGNDQIRRVYDTGGIAATLTTMQGGMQEPKIKVPSAVSSVYEEATEGDSINFTHPKSKTRRGRVGKQLAQTLDCACNQAVVEPSLREVIQDIADDAMSRIRKLTPRECLRLQDFSDSFVQVVSDSQQYKQAGNSMSVNVLEMLFRQIEKAKSNEPTNTLLDFMEAV